MYLQSPPPAFPFLLFLFSISSFLPACFSDASLQQYTDCSPAPFTCGNLSINISYPFRLGTRPDYCGYPGFDLTCTNNSAMMIRINNKAYQVKGVDYSNRLLTIVDPDFVGQTCPQPYKNTTLDPRRFEYSDRDQNLTVFLNCSSFPTPMLYSIDCLVNDTAGAGLRSYYGIQNGSLAGLGGICGSTVLVPVTRTAASLLMNGNLSFGGVLQEGFAVTWRAARAWCSVCVDSGGFCGFYSNSTSDRPCFCPSDLANGSCSTVGRNSSKKGIIIGAAACIGGFLLACLLFSLHRFWYTRLLNSIFFWKKKSDNAVNVEAFLERYGSFAPKRYKYSDVKKITKSFRDKLGQGGYGTVFKGSLDNGCLVAVKILSCFKGNGDEFVNEIASIGRTSHVNIVSLLGFCSEGSKRALIYEFMPNGSLEKYIYSEILATTLGLEKMYHIAMGIARGLEYLHRGCNTRIVHFDIKPHNILLDQEFCPKISDFGLAKLCPPKVSIISMADARGTIGYIAPEVFSRNFGVVSSKSDVYSYGMMVLEMVGCNKLIDDGDGNTSEIYFPHWIYEHLDQDRALQFCGITKETEEIARKMILVGLWCIQTRPGNRPSMSRVAEMLQGSVDDLSMPPKPYLSPLGSPSASSLELTSQDHILQSMKSSDCL